MLYREVQSFEPWIMWVLRAIMIATAGILGAVMLPIAPITAIVSILVIVGAQLLIEVIRLVVEIRPEEIKVGLRPYHWRHIPRADIESAKIIDYGFIGGYGIRYTSTYGTVYNARGRTGVQLELVSGKRVVIGIQDELKAHAALATFMAG